jgi:L-iditol 2-dehydrogenase
VLGAVYEEPGRVTVRQVPDPSCPRDGLLLRVHSSTICGTDVRVIQHGQADVATPRILGHEIVGRVAEIGIDLAGFAMDDAIAIRPSVPCHRCWACVRGRHNLCQHRVFRFGYTLDGGFAEYVRVPREAIDGGCVMRLSTGACLDGLSNYEPLACCLNAQQLASAGLGDTVLILGAGPIGCMHAVLARHLGAARVIVADVLERRVEMARRFQPDALVNSREEDLPARLRELTAGAGPSVVIVAVGSGPAQEQAIDLAGRGARVIFFAGLPHTSPTIALDANKLHYKQLSVFGMSGSSFSQQDLAMGLLTSGAIDGRSFVTHTLPIQHFSDGLEAIRTGEALKVAIAPGLQS